jgi:hypothetical protein
MVMNEEPPSTNCWVGLGYRQDYLKFHIAGPEGLLLIPGMDDEDALEVDDAIGHLPPVLERMQWKAIKVQEISGHFDYTSPNRWYSKADVSWGLVYDGSNRISQYEVELDAFGDPVFDADGDVESTEFSRIKGVTKKGHTLDATVGFGYRFTSAGGRFWAAPVVGYSYHEQNYGINHPRQVINIIDDEVGFIPSVASNYKSQWKGVYAGMDILLQLQCDLTVFGGGEWHWAQYRGSGRWNYDDLFVERFNSHTIGYGVVTNLGFDYQLFNCMSVGLVGKYSQFSTRKGKYKSTVEVNDIEGEIFGTLPTATDLKLSRVTWISWSVTVIGAFRF